MKMDKKKTTKKRKRSTETSDTAGKELVIVESPAKARTVGRILGESYNVQASVGHVRDLPANRLGVDVENGFEPRYVVPSKKKAVVRDLQRHASAVSGSQFCQLDAVEEVVPFEWLVNDCKGACDR